MCQCVHILTFENGNHMCQCVHMLIFENGTTCSSRMGQSRKAIALFTFAGEAFAAVDQSAESAFATFRAPAKRRYGWLAAAAALVLTVGIGSTSLLLRETGTEFSRAATPVPVGATLTVMDFESGSLEAVVGASNSAETVAVDHQEGVFRSDLESGDLGSWSSHS